MLLIDARGQHVHTPVHTRERRSRETACGASPLPSLHNRRSRSSAAATTNQVHVDMRARRFGPVDL